MAEPSEPRVRADEFDHVFVGDGTARNLAVAGPLQAQSEADIAATLHAENALEPLDARRRRYHGRLTPPFRNEKRPHARETEPVSDLVGATVDGGVLTVTLRRPEKRNALSRPLIAALGETFTHWRDREDFAVAVLTGEGDKAFASGGDVRELSALREEAETLAFAEDTRAAFDTIRRFPVPVVAALNGDALGGGAELAVACDLRIAASHARIGFLQATLNISTAWGGGTDLFRLVGPSRALLLLATAEPLGPERALSLGLIDAVAPDGEAFASALAAFVAPLATRPRQVAEAFKSLAIAYRRGLPASDMTDIETRAFAQTWVHPDHWQAVETRFNRRGGNS